MMEFTAPSAGRSSTTLFPLIPLDAEGEPQASVLAGPTCDSVDVIAEDFPVGEMAIGALIVAPMMGAYTAASASEFNSLPKTRVIALAPPASRSEADNVLRLA
jgi:ornithine decarboxylase